MLQPHSRYLWKYLRENTTSLSDRYSPPVFGWVKRKSDGRNTHVTIIKDSIFWARRKKAPHLLIRSNDAEPRAWEPLDFTKAVAAPRRRLVIRATSSLRGSPGNESNREYNTTPREIVSYNNERITFSPLIRRFEIIRRIPHRPLEFSIDRE